MTSKPGYFDRVRQEASDLWDKLDADPRLAGPWHQLFRQVQSPRHVLSELLQNADDVGATEASVLIEDHCFAFRHNGEDFTKEQFSSLCSFGYSNKRALHTIGFRGVGFKSTFSLGDTVELHTPTLSVAFHRQRFTQPEWLRSSAPEACTQVRVPIGDAHRERDIARNLQDWLKSAVSLLFLRHLRRLRIGEQDLYWGSLGPGPVPDTEWVALHSDPDHAFLVARSPEEPFPPEALEEIRQERLLGGDQEMDFPPCRAEIVLGAEGRLYVVLPTTVDTGLPFACNAPFVQDPSRRDIKDLGASFTNRWLLERVGTLAGSVMLQWLEKTSLSIAERARAYGLFTNVDRDDASLGGACATAIEEAFDAATGDRPYVLTEAGGLQPHGQAIAVPEEICDVWPAEQAAGLLDAKGRPALSRHVSRDDRAKLISCEAIDSIGEDDIITVLRERHLPKPKTWPALLKLWAYVASEVTGYRHRRTAEEIRLLPVQGNGRLYAAAEVARLGDKKLLQSESDWDLIARHLKVLNPNWPRFLAKARREAEEAQDEELQERVDAGYDILRLVGMDEASDAGDVVERVARAFFDRDPLDVGECVRFAQIAAKLGASVGLSFQFMTRDEQFACTDYTVIYDPDGALESLLPQDWYLDHALHPVYTASFASCTREEWRRWISSGRAGIHTFPPLEKTEEDVWGRPEVEAELHRRGSRRPPSYPYVTDRFVVEDWDFDEELWKHWAAMAAGDKDMWGRLGDHILSQPVSYWSKAASARLLQVSTTRSTDTITSEALPAAWILKLRDLPCLRDTHGVYHQPADLLLRTPETEALLDVEAFVERRLDTDANRSLLRLLGVGDTPAGPERLLDRLRALAKAAEPPADEVDRWYRRLDQMASACSTADLTTIRTAFAEESIVLAEDGAWVKAGGIFQSANEEDVPGAAVIRASVRHLSLWHRVGVADRPTADLALEWLKQLPPGEAPSQGDLRRVQSLLVRHPVRVWSECGHWLNLAGEWAPTGTLSYALTMQTLAPWRHLHGWVKQKAADLQRLPVEVTAALPFAGLSPLSHCIEDRLYQSGPAMGRPKPVPWLNQVGVELSRVEFDDQAETSRTRAFAARLAQTTWQNIPLLQVIPYIEGAPAGTPRRADVVWIEQVLYVDDLPTARVARLVPERLGQMLGSRTEATAGVVAALHYCFGRSPDDVTEYLKGNFYLVARGATAASAPGPVADSPVASAELPRSPSGPQIASVGVQVDDDAEAASVAQLHGTGPVVAGAEEEGSESARPEAATRKTPASPQPAQPSMIELFALGLGFRESRGGRLVHADGRSIVRTADDLFPWEMRSAEGEAICHYLAEEHCLEEEPLELNVEIWGQLRDSPGDYALVLLDPRGNPIELHGALLLRLVEAKKLDLHPATYRLVYNGRRRAQLEGGGRAK